MENLEIFTDEIANAIQSERYTILQVVAYPTERHGHMKGFSDSNSKHRIEFRIEFIVNNVHVHQ